MEALVYQPHQTLLSKDFKQKGIWDKASTFVQLLFVFFFGGKRECSQTFGDAALETICDYKQP